MIPDDRTIFAISSPPGKGGVAVVRLSGIRALEAAEALAGKLPQPRQAGLRPIRAPSGELIDRGLILAFPAPASFTGEHCAEIHVHGSRAVQSDLLSVLAAMPGLRLAEPGEFALRAFRNGKFDLTAAEGLADLIDAETSAQRRQALAQSDGALSKQLGEWRDQLIDLLALVEAELDFSDEPDVSFERARWYDLADRVADSMIAATAGAARGERLRQGYVIVIAGPPNAGKSSLLNALSRRDAALVSPHAGTTRDLIEVQMDFDGFPAVLIDTAGLRESADPVEQAGIARARARASTADLLLWVSDRGQPPTLDHHPVLCLWSKCDLDPPQPGWLGVSIHQPATLENLRSALTSHIRDALGSGEQALVVRARHQSQIECAAMHIAAAQLMVQGRGTWVAWELVAQELRDALLAIGRITGEVSADEVLGAIYSRFCVGK